MSVATLPSAAAAMPSAPASSVIGVRSVCHTLSGSARSASSANAGLHRQPVRVQRGQRAGGAAELRGQRTHARRSARSGPVDAAAPHRGQRTERGWLRPAATASGRPSACHGARGADRQRARRTLAQPGDDHAERARRRRASVRCRGCPGWWRRGAPHARLRRRRAPPPARAVRSTSGMTGLPPATERAGRVRHGSSRRTRIAGSADLERSRRARSDRPGRRPRRQRGLGLAQCVDDGRVVGRGHDRGCAEYRRRRACGTVMCDSVSDGEERGLAPRLCSAGCRSADRRLSATAVSSARSDAGRARAGRGRASLASDSSGK